MQVPERAVELRRWLRQLSYRYGWTVDVGVGHLERYPHGPAEKGGWHALLVRAPVDDSCGSGTRTTLQQVLFPPAELRRRGQFVAWFRDRLRELELHESDEWLRYRRGHACVVDPHADDAANPHTNSTYRFVSDGRPISLSPNR